MRLQSNGLMIQHNFPFTTRDRKPKVGIIMLASTCVNGTPNMRLQRCAAYGASNTPEMSTTISMGWVKVWFGWPTRDLMRSGS